MVPSGPAAPIGGSQNVSPSLLQSNSGMLEGGPVPSHASFPSMISPRTHINNMSMLGSMPDVSSVLGQSLGDNNAYPVFSRSVSGQRGGVDMGFGAELDPLGNAGNGMNYNMPSSSTFISGNPSTSGQLQGQHFQNSSNQMIPNQSPSRQLQQQNFQSSQQTAQQFSEVPKAQIGALASLGPVKLEPQMITEQLQSMNNINAMKVDSQQIPALITRNFPPVKMDSQQQQFFIQQQQQQQQQQQLLQLARQSSSPSQLTLQQQRMYQLQQQQHQQPVKGHPQQRVQLPQNFNQQNLALRASPVKSSYEPGMCAKRLTQFMHQQQHRAEDNNIEFWRKFVDDNFAVNAKKRWCVSMYGSGRHTTGVFPQEAWHCDICNRKPGRGFEATFEVLPRLFKIKYESGTLEELLHVDMPREHQNTSGQIVLDYAKAVQESVFDQLRVVREGQLRVVFSPDLKICSWEFCARHHEELIPRRLLLPQVSQLGAAAQKYQAVAQNAASTSPELQNNCNMFISSARQLAKALEVPLVNDLGYTKRYVRCLQISEVVNSMKDLIDYSHKTGTGPMESLAKFPRRAGATSVGPKQSQLTNDELQQQGQQHAAGASPSQSGVPQSSSPQSSPMQLPATSKGVGPANNPTNPTLTSGLSSSTIAGILHHQNSMNSRQHNSMSNSSSSYNGVAQNQSQVSSGSIPLNQSGVNNNSLRTSQNVLSTPSHMGSASSLPDVTIRQTELDLDNQSSMEKILQTVTPGSLGNDLKSRNGPLPAAMNPGPGLANSNGVMSNVGYNSMGGSGLGQSAMMMNGFRVAMANNSLMNGRVGMGSMVRDGSLNHFQQQDLGNQMMNGIGPGGGYSSSHQYEWKPTP